MPRAFSDPSLTFDSNVTSTFSVLEASRQANNVEKVCIVTSDKVYKNDKLYFDGPAMIVWPAGIFHRIISGDEGSISINMSTRNNNFNLDDNFNIYDLNIYSGEYRILKDGSEDQPDLVYKYPSDTIRDLFKQN